SRRSAMAASVTPGRALRYAGAPRAASYTNRWDTAAMSAMRGKNGPQPTGKLPPQLPTIVFHGDSDRVVHPSNAAGFLRNLERSRAAPLVCKTSYGRSPGGRDYTRKIHATRVGQTLLEEWTVHGSGHGWSGGRTAGSHTDPAGPNASREMLRFFLSRRRSG
ncbi:PHB depolymerase family esterase, partial [Paracoccus sp. Z118]|nr:PHB depolymerase family esterase [Paracoccus sp. Z118]